MSRSLFVATALFLPLSAVAQTAEVTWTQFVDPTEKAFAIEVPQGWTVKGGVNRITPMAAQLWATAASPDGSVQVFMGDPNVPAFSLPKPGQAEGTQLPSNVPELPPTVVLDYRPGAEFAKYYGPKSLAEIGCLDAALTGTQPAPGLAKMQADRIATMTRGVSMAGGFTPPPQDAGVATFSCHIGHANYAAGIIADTGQPGKITRWSVGVVAGYLTPPDKEKQARVVLDHILASRQWNPQWDEAMRQHLQEALNRQNQQAAQFSAQMQQQAAQFSAMMQANSNAQIATMTANHNAFMNQMNAQSAAHNAEFQNYEAARSLNSWNFDAHIRNGALYRDTNTGQIFEVDP